MSKKILLVGAGAVGVYFCGRLAQAGCDVTVIARSEYESVKANGYNIESINGDFKWQPKVIKSAIDYQDEADYIFVTTKVLPEVDVPSMIKDVVTPKSVIVLIQNGLDIEVDIHKAFPNNEIISSIAYIGVSRAGAGEVRHTGGGTLSCGTYLANSISESATTLNQLYAKAQVSCELVEDIELKRWQKLLWNVPFNTISVVGGGLDTKEMMADENICQLAWNLMCEVQLVARHYGRELPDSILEYNMEYTRNFPPYKTSMLLDYEHGRPLEVEAIVGNVLKRAAQKGLKLPHIESIYALLSALNNKNI